MTEAYFQKTLHFCFFIATCSANFFYKYGHMSYDFYNPFLNKLLINIRNVKSSRIQSEQISFWKYIQIISLCPDKY